VQIRENFSPIPWIAPPPLGNDMICPLVALPIAIDLFDDISLHPAREILAVA
jgi:hypothetical protein